MPKKPKMSDDEANELRLVANEIMSRLYEAGQLTQLRILELYATQALKTAKTMTGKTPAY